MAHYNVKIVNELIKKQLKDVPEESKLSINDILRISKKLHSSIFDENNCSIWQGYIAGLNKYLKHRTNASNISVTFYFKNKKVSLQRLLYNNYKGLIERDEYLKFTCNNPGKCCNLNHIIKFKYRDNKNSTNSKAKINKPENIVIENENFKLYFD